MPMKQTRDEVVHVERVWNPALERQAGRASKLHPAIFIKPGEHVEDIMRDNFYFIHTLLCCLSIYVDTMIT